MSDFKKQIETEIRITINVISEICNKIQSSKIQR